MRLLRRAGGVAWAAVLVSASLVAAQSASRKAVRVVRVPSASVQKVAQLGIAPRLDLDYGGFHWMEVAAEDAARLSDEHVAFEEVEGAGEVHVPGYRFDPLFDGPPRVAARLARREGRAVLKLVQFHGPARKEWLHDLEARGMKVLQYYPHNTYLVRETTTKSTTAPEAALGQAASPSPYVRWQGPFEPAYKIDRQLASMSGLIRNVDVAFLNEGDADQTLQAIQNLGARLVRHYRAQPDAKFYDAIVELDAAALDAVAALSNVIWLGYQPPKPSLTDEMSDQVLAGNATSGTPTPGYGSFLSDLGYDGSGVTWAIVDTGIDWDHPDLSSHIVGGFDQPGAPCIEPGRPGNDCGGHGTHVSGIVAGDASAGFTDQSGFLYGLGVAPRTGLFAINFLSGSNVPGPAGFQELSRQALLGGAVGANNSWTYGMSQSYQATERTHDVMVRDGNFETTTLAEPFIEVFAAANFAQPYSMGSPAAAKNVISVASSNNFRLGDIHAISSFSSRGPTPDGRLAPTITAPGAQIASTRNDQGGSCSTPIPGTNDSYAFCSGTSMAAPHVSGAIALITEWWRGTHEGANPSPAMAKALLVNGATPLGVRPIPNNDEGWGMVNLQNTIQADAPRILEDQTTLLSDTGASHDIAVTVADPSKPLRITLAWTDAPGALGADPALVNDLDLIVSTDGVTYRGNSFADGWSVPGGLPDVRNNLENVYVQNPGANAVISVRATSINGDGVPYNGDSLDQDFALVCYNCVASTTPAIGIVVLPAQQRVCPPGGTSFQVTTTALNGLSGPISLSVSSIPAGISASFFPNPVEAGGTATLTITDTGGAPGGIYAVAVSGAAGAQNGVGSAELAIDGGLVSPALVSPDDGTVLSATPTFTWSAVPGVASYTLEVAPESTFDHIVYAASGLTGTSRTVLPAVALPVGSYYWRVRGENACGSSASTARSFTTWGAIQGEVRNATGAPLAEVYVYIRNTTGDRAAYAQTDAAGRYLSPALPPGTYNALTVAPPQYVDVLYDGIPCPGGLCDMTRGTSIPVAVGAVTRDIDFTLGVGGRISGTVTDASGKPLSGVSVYFGDAAGSTHGVATTDSAGLYASSALLSGTYYATTSNSLGYVDERYDDVVCPLGNCGLTAGEPITVTAPNTTGGIDFVLAPGGRISGTVRNTAGAPLQNVTVAVSLPDGGWSSFTTNASGTYTTGGLPSGTYYLRTSNRLGYIDELYNDLPCPGGACTVTSGTPVTVTAPTTTAGVDFVLAAGGRIGGRITDMSGAPLRDVSVEIFDPAGTYRGSNHSDASGIYLSGGLPSGTYYARTWNSLGYLDEAYNGISCPGGVCTPTSATPISVIAPDTTTGIDFALAAGGRISGRVTDLSGAPLSSVSVDILDAAGAYSGFGYTDASGVYLSGGLPSGTYYVRTSNSLGYLDELFDDVACPGRNCALTSGTPISVTATTTTTGIDFALAAGGRISGRVTDLSGAPLSSVSVDVLDAANVLWGYGYTDEAGVYVSGGLPSGTYYVRTSNSLGYVDELFNDISCSGGNCTPTSGTRVNVTAPHATTGIDFALARGGRISGQITDASGTPLPSVSVSILDAADTYQGSGYTDASGIYLSGGLPAGTYYVRTSNTLGYLDELFNDVPCPAGTCAPTSGTPISVTASNTTGGIDFSLARGGKISGRVTDAFGAPLRNVSVEILDATGAYRGYGYTDGSGFYTAGGLPSGTYHALTWNSLGYMDEAYNDLSCPAGRCTPTNGTPIGVTAPNTTTGIDFVLARGGQISGRIADASGRPLGNVSVQILDAAASYWGSAYTDQAGGYASGGLPSGTYYVRTWNYSLGYLDELYDDVPCVAGSCGVAGGKPVVVTSPRTTTGIDFVLASSDTGRIRGRVIDKTGASLANVTVDLFDLDGRLAGSGASDATGWYTTAAVPAGYYRARTQNSRHFIDELYDNVPCPGGACSLDAGSRILVNAGQVVSAINFILESDAQSVFWRNVVGATASGNNLTKTAATWWGNGGASSLQQITGNGYAEFTVTETTSYRMAGLANGDSSQHYSDIDFAVYLARTSLQVYEGGTTQVWTGGTLSPGDRIRIAVNGGVVRYYQNGTLFYTSTKTPRLPLCLDTSLYDQGSTITDASIFAEPGPAGPPVAVITAPKEGRVGTPITFDGTWSWDPDGSVVDYLWDFADGTTPVHGAIVSHTFAAGGPFVVTLTVTDDGGHPGSATQTEKISQLVFWRNVVGATASGNSLTKTAVTWWGNAGASSIQVIPAEGYVEFTLPDTAGRWMAGLSNGDSDQTFKDIDFAVHQTQGNLLVFEGGVGHDLSLAVGAGTRIRVAIESGVVKYYLNGTLVYTSTNTPKLPLCLDAALYDQGATIADATVFAMPGAPGPPVAVITAKTEARAGTAITFDGTGSWDPDGSVVDYTWDFGDGTPPVTGPTVSHTYTFGASFPVTLTVHDNSGLAGSTTQNERISQSVFWKNVVGATPSSTNLTKTATAGWGNAGASSVQQIIADGWVEFTVPDTYGRWMAGLSNGDSNQSFNDIDFAVHQTQGNLLVFEGGVGHDLSLTTAAGDRIRVAAESGVVKYYQNGTLIYTSANRPRFPLCLDTSLYDQGATIKDATVFAPTASPGTPMALISGPTTGSIGTPITLDGSASWDPDGTIVHYYWYFADGEMGEGPIVTHSFGPGTYRVQLTVVDNDNKSNTSAPFEINVAAPLFWMNVVGATAAGNNLTKTAPGGWGNAGAASIRVLPSDGWVEITASETTTSRMFGLSHGDSNQSYTDIDFAMYLNGANLLVYEGGTQQGSGAFTTYATGDLLRVSVSGGVVTYSKNGVVFYTSTATPSFPLLVDTALLNQGATISGAFVFAKPGPAAPPVAVVSAPTEGRVAVPISFDGRGSWDSDGQVVSWLWEFGDGSTDSGSTPTHAFAAGGPFTVRLTVTDNLGLTGTVTQVVKVAEPVDWMNVVGAAATGNNLTKTAAAGWGNAGAVSTRVIASGEGWVEITASETTTSRMFGLSRGDSNQSYTDIDFAMYLNGGNLLVFEGGIQQGDGAFPAYATGDRLRVAVSGGVVRYSRNGVVFYTSSAAPTSPLLLDTALLHQGATIQDATIYVKPAAAGPPVAQILGPTEGRVGVPLTFDGRGSWDPDGSVVAWAWSFGDGGTASGPTVTHTYSSAGAFSLVLTVTDNSGLSVSLTQTEKIADVVVWTNVVGATASGNNLTKTATGGWGSAGAVSTRTVASGNAWVEVTASETTTNRMFGLSNGDSNQSYTDIDFALYLNGGNLLVYEKGTQQGGGVLATYATGDRLRVAVAGGIVSYSKNGVVLYTSTATPTYPLLVDTALMNQGATIQDAGFFAP